jgi:hypothetical protein
VILSQILQRLTCPILFKDSLSRGGILGELGGGSWWARLKHATAIWASPVKYVFSAFDAEGAFERTHHRAAQVGWQILVAAFAIGSHLKHFGTPL